MLVVCRAQVPYVAGGGYYGPAGSGVGTCSAQANAAGTAVLGWTTVWPQNDDGLSTALLLSPVKVCSRTRSLQETVAALLPTRSSMCN